MLGAALAVAIAVTLSASAPSAQRKIVFVGGGAETDVYSINVDGTGLKRLTDHPYADVSPAWSPDGRRIAFVGSLGPAHAIGPAGLLRRVLRVMNANGSGVRDVSLPLNGGSPTWSPDGRRIAYYKLEHGKGWSLHVMNDEGANEVQIWTAQSAVSLSLDWSPNGRWIAFTPFQDGRTQIAVLRPDGSDLHRLVASDWNEFQPSWSPDGRRLAFVGSRGNQSALFIVNADGKRRVNLTRNFGFRGMHPNWSPDGRRIVYGCWRGGVCIGDLRTGSVRVVARAVNGRAPDWQPR